MQLELPHQVGVGVSGVNIEPSGSPRNLRTPDKGASDPRYQILIIDDDVDLCDLLAESLRRQGFVVAFAHDGIAGLERSLRGHFALIVLDLMLPGLDGSEVLKRIRSRSNVPVIILTAKGEESDRIVGLKSGADDYMAKPFNPGNWRRESSGFAPSLLRGKSSAGRSHLGDVSLNSSARTVRRGDRAIELTSVEFDLLVLFLKSPGKVLGREELTRAVLGRELRANDRSIDVHVSNLRRKLGANLDDRNA